MNYKDINKCIDTIEFSSTNIDLLGTIKYFINVVINDIEYMNKDNEEQAFDYLIDYDLGNNNYIKGEDLESLVSIVDTINNIIEYNKEEYAFINDMLDYFVLDCQRLRESE